MNLKKNYIYDFLMKFGIWFWLFIIPSIIFMLHIETGAPEPTLFFVVTFISGLLFAILFFIGNYIIIPVAYFIGLILIILDVYRFYFNKISEKKLNNYNIVYKIFAILGFILGGITSALAILDVGYY